MKYLEQIINRFKNRNVKLMGCIKNEINIIEENITREKLPDCYIEFLEIMGKDIIEDPNSSNYFEYGNFKGSYVFYKDLEDNNNENGLKGLLLEDESELQVPQNAFIFYGHQGYIYAFFKLDEGNNPPVYAYIEGYNGNEFPKISDSLSDFYERYLEGDKSLFNKLY